MNNSEHFFSIIIPTYNHGHFIKRCLNSLLQQTHQNWEAIVVNNFSEDNTIEVVEGFQDPRIRLINNANKGIIAVSRNRGLSEVRGDWVCFLDSDDWWYPNKLEISIPHLSDSDLIYHDLDIYTNEKKSIGVAKGRILKGNLAKDLIINGNGIANSSVVVRKGILDLIGKITEDRNLIAVEDFDYWIRVAKVTDRFKYINQSLGAYWEGENISYSTKQIGRTKNLLDKYTHELSGDERKSAVSLHYFNSARMYHALGLYSDAREYYLKAINAANLSRMTKALTGYLMCLFRIK